MNGTAINFNQHAAVLGQFRQLLENYQFNNDDWEMLMNIVSYRSAEKNTVLQDFGSMEKVCRLILKGIVKITFHEDEPFVFDFRKEGDYLTDIVSLTKKIKSSFRFETVTTCEWMEVSLSDWMQLSDKISNALPMIVVDHLKKGYEREAFLRIHCAKDRYEEFCITHTEMVKHAKLEDIASFLDITPQSLSRIRKNCLR